MKPRISKYLRGGPSSLAWECSSGTGSCRGYGDTPKAAYDAWAKSVQALINARFAEYVGGNDFFHRRQQ